MSPSPRYIRERELVAKNGEGGEPAFDVIHTDGKRERERERETCRDLHQLRLRRKYSVAASSVSV